MAEKEERIYISGYSETNPCDVCDDLSGEECDYCEKNREWNASITRQEAIEKMAKARYAQSPCYDARGNKVSFEDFRENYEPCYEDLIKEVDLLLNALLED